MQRRKSLEFHPIDHKQDCWKIRRSEWMTPQNEILCKVNLEDPQNEQVKLTW